MVLVDTSVWVEVFRRPALFDLESVIDFDEVVTCLPVVQEVLQGFDDENAFQAARVAMRALPIVESPLGANVFDEAVSLYRLARRRGLTIRSSTDCLIATCALKNGLALLHADRDYDAIAQVSGLDIRTIRTG